MILLALILLVTLQGYAPGSGCDTQEKTEQWLQGAELTPEHLKAALEIAGVMSADVVFAQARLETGNFTSELCRTHNNLFGMRQARRRETTALGATPNNYAAYNSWFDSVKDVSLFQEWYKERGRDLTDYFSFLALIGYAEDPNYLNKLQVCIRQQ